MTGCPTTYPGGAARAISEGLILPLNDLIENYSPNLRRIIEEYPEIARNMKTDDGIFYGYPDGAYEIYPRAAEVKPANKNTGLQIRKDWLDKLGLSMPETIDEWYDVLVAFKTQDPNGNGEADEIPLSHRGSKNTTQITHWMWAWGIPYDFYVVDGKVDYGMIQPEYLAYLTTMSKWYEEGLLDPDYVTNDAKQFDAKVTNGQVGAWSGTPSGNLGRYVQLINARDPEAYLTGTIPPIAEEGGVSYYFNAPSFFPIEDNTTVISANCKYPEIAAQLLDFGYSEVGDALYNWGVEGESYINDNGTFSLTEHITNNEDGLSLDEALARYAPGAHNGPMFKPNSLWNQRMWMPEQQEAIANWGVGSGERILPPVSLLPEESSIVADIMSRVNTYNEEMLNKFIMGIVPLSEFDDYVANQQKMGIDQVIEVYQVAYDRYVNR